MSDPSIPTTIHITGEKISAGHSEEASTSFKNDEDSPPRDDDLRFVWQKYPSLGSNLDQVWVRLRERTNLLVRLQRHFVDIVNIVSRDAYFRKNLLSVVFDVAQQMETYLDIVEEHFTEHQKIPGRRGTLTPIQPNPATKEEFFQQSLCNSRIMPNSSFCDSSKSSTSSSPKMIPSRNPVVKSSVGAFAATMALREGDGGIAADSGRSDSGATSGMDGPNARRKISACEAFLVTASSTQIDDVVSMTSHKDATPSGSCNIARETRRRKKSRMAHSHTDTCVGLSSLEAARLSHRVGLRASEGPSDVSDGTTSTESFSHNLSDERRPTKYRRVTTSGSSESETRLHRKVTVDGKRAVSERERTNDDEVCKPRDGPIHHSSRGHHGSIRRLDMGTRIDTTSYVKHIPYILGCPPPCARPRIRSCSRSTSRSSSRSSR